MINKAWVLLFIETLFGVFLLVHMIYYYRFRSQSDFHCFAWETNPGQIVNLSSVLELCPQGIGQWVFHNEYICPVLPDPPTTSLSHALINYYYRIVYNCSFRQIFWIEKSLWSLIEGRFLKEVFCFLSFISRRLIRQFAKTSNTWLYTSHFIFSRLSLSQKIEFHLIRGLHLLFCLQRIFIAIEYRNEAHNASLNAVRVCK